jgi:superfamily II DNA or RNA helicase
VNRVDRFIVESSSWATFHAAASLLTNKEKGDLFERAAQLYLETTPEYRTSLTNVWPLHKTPAHVLAEIGLPRNDVGIDLIARHRDGRYWAIQAKFRTIADKALSWGDLSTAFGLASAPRRNISQFVVIHSTAKPISNRELMGSIIEIGLDRMQNADWPIIQAHIRNNGKDRHEPRTPTGRFAWQEKPVNDAVEHFKANARGRMQLPCGTGKSLIAYYIAERLNANMIVVAVPSLNLVRQSVHDTWLREEDARGRKTDWLCVASDDTVGQDDNIADERPDTGLPTTTNVNEIADWLRRANGRKIVFTTYHSSPKLAEAARLVGSEFDLIVLDEAHRTAGDRNREFVTLLHDEKINARRRLFMTATERKVNGNVDALFSMDKHVADYGARFYTMSFKEAIERDIITDYRIVVYAVTDKEVKDLINRNRLLNLGHDGQEAVGASDVASAVAVKRIMKEYGVRHPLAFARSIRASKDARVRQDLLNEFTSIGPFAKNFHVDSTMPTAERAQSLAEWIETSIGTMFNARCLTEGVDVPGVDAVVFTAPKQSTVDIVQAAGRALRKAPGKECGYIVIPIIVQEGVAFDEVAKDTPYHTIMKIIAAISTQDERIVEELRARFNGPTTGNQRRERLITIGGDVPVGLGVSLEEFADKIEMNAWSAIARGGNYRSFIEARDFARSLGLKNVKEWFAFAQTDKRPVDIPVAPNTVYADSGWTSWADWLETRNVRGGWRPFAEARDFARSLGLKGVTGWYAFAKTDKRPIDIPSNPQLAYADSGWTSWADWLGGCNIRTHGGNWRSFTEARDFVRSLGLKSQVEWKKFAKTDKKPIDIPAHPDVIYANDGWIDVADWLGTKARIPAGGWRPFDEARDFARSLELKSKTEWNKFARTDKKPIDIPINPYKVYADSGWTNWADWLGKAN